MFTEFRCKLLVYTYLTTAAGENIDPKTLQSMSGHADHQMTMNVYAHAKKENVARANDGCLAWQLCKCLIKVQRKKRAWTRCDVLKPSGFSDNN